MTFHKAQQEEERMRNATRAIAGGCGVLFIVALAIGIPRFKAASVPAAPSERFLDISLEAMVEGPANSVYVTQEFWVKTAQKNIKHGLILNFPNYDKTYSPPVGPLEYEFLSGSIDRRDESGKFTRIFDLPLSRLKSANSSQVTSLKLGDDSVELPSGVYHFQIGYRVRNSIFPIGDKNEGANIVAAKPSGFWADNIKLTVFPPGMAKVESVSAGAWVQAKGTQDGKSFLKNVEQLTSTINPVPGVINIAGEPVSIVTVDPKRAFGESESLALLVKWPRGFVISSK